MKGLEYHLELVGDRRAVEPGKITGQRVGYLLRSISDRIEGLPDQDMPGERRTQKYEDEDGDKLVSQHVIFKTEIEETEQRCEEKKGEDDGQTKVESPPVHEKVKPLFLVIHEDISLLLSSTFSFML